MRIFNTTDLYLLYGDRIIQSLTCPDSSHTLSLIPDVSEKQCGSDIHVLYYLTFVTPLFTDHVIMVKLICTATWTVCIRGTDYNNDGSFLQIRTFWIYGVDVK